MRGVKIQTYTCLWRYEVFAWGTNPQPLILTLHVPSVICHPQAVDSAGAGICCQMRLNWFCLYSVQHIKDSFLLSRLVPDFCHFQCITLCKGCCPGKPDHLSVVVVQLFVWRQLNCECFCLRLSCSASVSKVTGSIPSAATVSWRKILARYRCTSVSSVKWTFSCRPGFI